MEKNAKCIVDFHDLQILMPKFTLELVLCCHSSYMEISIILNFKMNAI